MEARDSLANHFLIAMPSLADPNFTRTVTYICEHGEEGAMGLVVNRPLELSFTELLSHVEIEPPARARAGGEQPIYQGGPVQNERGFVLHRPPGDWEASLAISAEIGLTMSRDIIEAIAEGSGPRDYLIALGYAGWGAGQLEEELAGNAWLNGPADPAVLFDTPVERRWEAAAAHLGVDLALLSTDIGHA